MATLTFPLGSHMGKLIWDTDSEKLTSEQLKNASYILYYMGYNVHEDTQGEGIIFDLRLYKHTNKDDNFRNVLFDFVFLFHMMDINLPDLEYSKAFLHKYFIPFNKKNKVSETRAIVYNDNIYLTFTNNYMVNGKGYPFQHLELYINQFNDGEELLPIIGNDISKDIILKLRIDAQEGEPLNDNYSWKNNRKVDTEKNTDIDELLF